LKLKIPTAILFASVLLMMMVAIPVKAESGARTDDLIIKFYGNVQSAYAALKAGDVDAVGYELQSLLYADAITDPNIILGAVGDRGKYEFDINNNYTCSPLFPGLRSPTSYLNFRRGLAFLVNKAQVVNVFCGGFANRIDQPMAYQHKGWRNQSYWYEDGTYPYEFNAIQAVVAFNTAGFVQGTDLNPEPDTGAPGYATYLRIHPDTGTTMDPITIYSRTDDLRRLEAGQALCNQLRNIGIPIVQIDAPSSVCYPAVMDNFAYHVYTGGWSLGRFPALTAHGLYHASEYYLTGSNYISGNNSVNAPNYPTLDAWLQIAKFPANYSQAQTYARLAFGEIVEQCITIELFSAASFWAWSSELKGVVNADGTGPENGYTFVNAYKIDGSAIYYGLITAPNEMNKIYSSWYYDYQCLDRMDLYSGIDVAPYDQSVDQTGYILGWNVDSWTDPDDGLVKSNITQTYRDDAWFVKPFDGDQLEHVNITHHYAAIWYDLQATPPSWNRGGVADIKTTRIIDPYTIQILWNVTGYWNTYLGGTSIRSFNWYNLGSLSQTVTDNNLVPDGSGYIGCTEPVFYVLSITGDGTPLVLGTDYDIYMDPDGPHNADVRILTGPFADVDITYLATDDARGDTPGGIPWQQSFEGAGMFYAVAYTPLVGGSIALKRNPFYPMETPPLGEIDFLKKGTGCYKIDIYDVVIAASAYGSQAEYIPDGHWFAGADLAPSGGKIDIFDIVTITGKYGTEYDCP